MSTVEIETPELAGYTVIVPSELWDDFRLFLIAAGIDHGRTSHQRTDEGNYEQLQFFPGRNATEVEQVKVAYLIDRQIRLLDYITTSHPAMRHDPCRSEGRR